MPSRNTKANAGGARTVPSGLPRAPAPLLVAPRLTLRPFRLQDAAAMQAYASSPGFFRFITDVPAAVREHYTLAHATAHIRELQHLQASGYPSWALVPRKAPRAPAGPGAERPMGVGAQRGQAGDAEKPMGAAAPIGAIRLNRGTGEGVPDLGFGLHAAWRGKGLMREAAEAVLRWTDTRLPKLGATALGENVASRRLLSSLGFEETGTDAAGRILYVRSARPHPSSPEDARASATKP